MTGKLPCFYRLYQGWETLKNRNGQMYLNNCLIKLKYEHNKSKTVM